MAPNLKHLVHLSDTLADLPVIRVKDAAPVAEESAANYWDWPVASRSTSDDYWAERTESAEQQVPENYWDERIHEQTDSDAYWTMPSPSQPTAVAPQHHEQNEPDNYWDEESHASTVSDDYWTEQSANKSSPVETDKYWTWSRSRTQNDEYWHMPSTA